MAISEAWATVIGWAGNQGMENAKDLPGLWTGETDEWKVSVNGHREEVGGVPPYGIQLENKVFVQVAVIQPNGGAICGSEDALIDHFKTLQNKDTHRCPVITVITTPTRCADGL